MTTVECFLFYLQRASGRKGMAEMRVRDTMRGGKASFLGLHGPPPDSRSCHGEHRQGRSEGCPK